jgi:uncharacterized LabA/DUF88 family protein
MRTSVFVDGFNLYYGAVKGTPYKWLNLLDMAQRLFPNDTVVSIKYFTAIVSARPNDPGKPNRQLMYLRALRTLPGLQIILGSFISHTVPMVLAGSPPHQPQFATVIKTEEKGSDVNIAAHLVNDAHRGVFEHAVLVSNDSDLAEPIRIVTQELGLPVTVVNPHRHKTSWTLVQHATSTKRLRAGLIRTSQFPPIMRDAAGTFHRPAAW